VSLLHGAGVFVFKNLTRAICRVDESQFDQVPDRGPLILIANHVHIVELPLIYTHLEPRPMTALVASHRWDRFWTRILVEESNSIPLNRTNVDVTALRLALDALEQGKILAIAPEGTRSGDGRLQRGLPGVVLLALKSDAPILPVVHYGSENYKRNLARLQRSDFHLAVGEMFRLRVPEGRITREIRNKMLEEMMYRMAVLLPPEYRGFYSDVENATEEYLVPTS